ncbi:MAG: serine/threonine protein kinase, partial [Lentisphaeria bacterium]|nr:serine/threonine protein kinase [Lentisphaeria bacterium]
FDAICDEHDFVFDCVESEIPVVAPLMLTGGGSIGEVDGIYFAIYPKKSGRQFELIEDEDWLKVGRLLGRLHQVGSQADADFRISISPMESTRTDLKYLEDHAIILPEFRQEISKVIEQIIECSIPLFEGVEFIRVHGDAHHSNFIDRLNGEVLIIDFDDMVMGPAIQDFWLLLGEHIENCRSQFNLMVEGYEEFRAFDYAELKLVESLRAMRMIYFTAWCAMQRDDLVFQKRFPNWGNRNFWEKELDDLHRQLALIRKN